MPYTYLLLLILIGIGAGFVQRVSGFGLGIFSMIFMPHILPAQSAAAVSCLLSCATSTYNAIRYRKDTIYRTALPMICAALITIPLAVRYAKTVSADRFAVILGVVLILFSIYFLLFYQRIRLKATLGNAVLAGTLGGALNGLFSTGGPPVVLYLSCAMPGKQAYFATIQFYFCFTNLYATLMRAINGMINKEVVLYWIAGTVGCLLGDFLGRIVFDKLDVDKLKKIIYVGMIISGILMLT